MLPKIKLIISTGGTGGHIFPALALAETCRKKYPESEILFIGAKGKMEMEKVSRLKYPIIGLPLQGFQRSFSLKNIWSNFCLPFQLLFCCWRAFQILWTYNPNVVLGFGGYASFPTVFVAQLMGIPTVIQEQNSFVGLSNRILSKKARKIAVAFEGMEQSLPAEKIVLTGNPIRRSLVAIEDKKAEALAKFGFSSDYPVLLIIGGSQGARMINQAIEEHLQKLLDYPLQIIWQTGEAFYIQAEKHVAFSAHKLYVKTFIEEMNLAYAAADFIVSRAGAMSLAELACIGKPTILVPYPYSAENHQLKNAKIWQEKGAALFLEDFELKQNLYQTFDQLMNNTLLQQTMTEAMKKFAFSDAVDRLLEETEPYFEV